MGGTTCRLQCQRVGMRGTGWACCVWGRVGRGHVRTCQLCQPPTERCSTLPGGCGRVGAAFPLSVTREMATPNLYHPGSPSLNCHRLWCIQCLFWLSPSLPREHIFLCPPLPHPRWGLHPAVPARPDAAGGGFDCTGKKLSQTSRRQMKLQQEGFQSDVKKDAPFGKERKAIT